MRNRILGMMVALPLLGAACGFDDGGGGVASLSDPSDAPTSAPEDREAQALAWAGCMREHGVDVPDPKFDDRGLMLIEPGDGPLPSERAMEEANETCQDLLGDPEVPELTPQERAALHDAALEFAECMRREGFDVPDPEPGGQMAIPIGGTGGFDPNDPGFAAADERCRPLLDDVIGAAPTEGVPQGDNGS